MRTILGLALAAALATTMTDPARAAPRTLAVPADKGWMHAQTRLVLRPQVAGLTRLSLSDSTATEHDVTAQFESADHATFATLYLFHSALPEVAVWFDRARATLEARDLFRHAAPASEAPIAFAASGTTPAALRQTYAIVDGPNRSTALAVMPLGEWLVVLRMTGRGNSAALDRQLTDFVAALRLPEDGAARPAAPIAACPAVLAYGRAKMVKPETTDLLLSFLGAMAAQEKEAEPVPASSRPWCREGEPGAGYAAYRREDESDGYGVAIQDAGRVAWARLSTASQLAAQQREGERLVKAPSYAVTLSDVDGRTMTFPSFTALPTPRQVFDDITKQRPLGSALGKQVTIDAKAMQ
ncbi:hypothetical protein KZ813_18800 [Sphingomonas sp. RHCKR7]|uniref:hypothetical protein n=1 Tax=Sphingomonas folli TaxID=2862497 RepID=UPI001CA50C95|nr:hypothetical protein [Sphingomonas folli]MBW6528894.1 hypothetical protein [Sphingomonas folli]